MGLFFQFLTEQSEDDGKLKHIHHAEDRPLLHGASGFTRAYKALMHAHNHVKSGGNSSAVTMKYDGSPSLVFGHDPESGKFFVASKSAFNKKPKINYTHEDIERNHGHVPGLAAKLHESLNHLKKIAPKTGVYQGDLMFGDGDKKETSRGVSFTPNTITYTARGKHADDIRRAKLGIVVHQQYHGDTLDSMKADPHPDTHNFTKHPDVWMQSAEHDTSNVHYSDDDQKEFLKHLAAAKKIHDEHGKEMYAATKMHQGDGGHLTTYINATVRDGSTPNTKDFAEHISQQYKKQIAKLKTPAAQARKMAELKMHLDHIQTNKKHYDNMLKMHNHLQQAKNVLVNTLNQHTGNLEHDINGTKTDPEGFVANHDGEPTKLVNRAEFSRANLLKVR